MAKTERSELFIGGQWVRPDGAGTIDVIDPSTEKVLGQVPEGTAVDIDRAVEAARAAVPVLAAMAPEERAVLCERLADAIEANALDIGALVSSEVGTPMPGAVMLHAGVAVALFRQYAAVARTYAWRKEVGEFVISVTPEYAFEPRPGTSVVVSEPIGVVGAITPWNYPLTLAAYKIAPALAAGCPVVLKPSEVAPLSAFVLADLVSETGWPAGALNVVSGYGVPAGERLASHPDVDMVTFTGSTAAGRRVAALAADSVKRVKLELGGKSAVVVLPGADLEAAVSTTLRQVFMNAGQTCLAWSRLLVPADQQDEAVEIARRLVEANFPVGAPSSGSAVIGPVVSKVQHDRVTSYIRGAIDEGARLVTGGTDRPDGLDVGYYIAPTVLADVRPDHRVAQEEVFGPVLAIMPYDDVDDAVSIANGTIYGLHGAVFADSDDAAIEFANRLQTGQVDINGMQFNFMAPFGGYRQSGNGKELGIEGFESFLETKTLQIVRG